MSKTVDEILGLCGGAAAVTAALGVARGAERNWRRRGREAIPARHHLALIRLSNGALTLEDFAAAPDNAPDPTAEDAA